MGDEKTDSCQFSEFIHIAGIDFAGHRLLDQINGQNESVGTLFLDEDSLESSERTLNDFHPISFRNIGIGIVGESTEDQFFDILDLRFRDQGGLTIEADDANDRGDFQNVQSPLLYRGGE